MRPTVAMFFVILAGSQASAQPDDPKIVFEAASVKPFPEGQPIQMSGCTGGPGSDDPGRITCEYVTLKMLVMRAYQVKAQEVFGPGLLESARFNILAKLPSGAAKEQVPIMFRNLLAERFKLVVHRESRQIPAYVITVSKGGLKMKETPPPSADPVEETPKGGPLPIGKDGFPTLRPSSIKGGAVTLFRNGQARLQAGGITVAKLAETFSFQLDRIVTDETGLAGKYDVTLYWTPESTEAGARRPPLGPDSASDPGTEPNVFVAAEQQLGLKLVSKKVARDVVVVDSAEKTPTLN